jgi:hypothetical protein
MIPESHVFLGENGRVYLLVCPSCHQLNREDKIDTGTCAHCGYQEVDPGTRGVDLYE